MASGSIEWVYADDDFGALKMFSDAVNSIARNQKMQINLTTFRTGDEVILALKNRAIKNCIIFLDINIPGKNGFQVLKELKASTGLGNFPVVMYSTSKGKISIDISYELGADLYIIKPDTKDELQKLLLKVIQFDFSDTKPAWNDFVLNS